MNPTPAATTALALFSGGLDSILACRVVATQGIAVRAVRFVTPFFGDDLLAREADYRAEMLRKYDIDVHLIDVTGPFLELLRRPAHGFGRHFNPCVDCKIFLLATARRRLADFNASFLITGEVIGQRPMSQRRDTLRLIERDSGCSELLVRPLCARNLPASAPESAGLIDRHRLLAFSGRGRSAQIELATRFGITDFPSPAGGCILTDPILAARISHYYQTHVEIRPADIRLLLVGRQFVLPGGGWLVLGRDQKDNEKILALRQPDDIVLDCIDRPGPFAILRYGRDPADLSAAAGLLARYTKKNPALPREVQVETTSAEETTVLACPPIKDAAARAWQR
ncbi:MAG: thiamine biosynthesis protein [Deltaproteobacteria bacterium RIFOXYD12_FULL_57_12]|nr:MAG: thiamine biosynthesis protein [Deltaproteobacteria bacterium RIFOXYD12_FULL_57_12]